jgi:hypothetical protein
MSWIKRILISCAIALMLLVHLSLFFCEESFCAISLDRALLWHWLAYRIELFLLTLPIRLGTLQNLAQWMIFGEIMLVIIELVKLIRRIFCFLVWIVLTVACFFGLVTYLSNTDIKNMEYRINFEKWSFWPK